MLLIIECSTLSHNTISYPVFVHGNWKQWRNRWGQGGRVPPRLLTRKFLLMYREKRGKENMKNGAERKENLKREGERWKIENARLKMQGGKVTSYKNR